MASLKELPWLSHKSKNSIFILLFKWTETPLGLRAGISIVILKIKFYNIVQILVLVSLRSSFVKVEAKVNQTGCME